MPNSSRSTSVTCDYYYNESHQVLETRKDSDGDPLEQFAWDIRYIDAPLVWWLDSDTNGSVNYTFYPTNDANFNVTMLYQDSGSVALRLSYDPYGRREVLDGFNWTGAGDPYGFSLGHQGLMHDEETGLIYNRARMLHPTLGRFVQRDPAQYMDGMGLYLAAASAPLNHVDPNGLLTWRVLPTQWIVQPTLPPAVPSRPPPDGIQWIPPGGGLVLAATVPRLSVTCKCKGFFCWKLDNVEVDYGIEVYLGPDYLYFIFGIDPAWVRRAEGDHIQDFDTWAQHLGRPNARLLEQQEKTKKFSKKDACLRNCHDHVFVVLRDALLDSVRQSGATWDASGRHTWSNPNHRP